MKFLEFAHQVARGCILEIRDADVAELLVEDAPLHTCNLDDVAGDCDFEWLLFALAKDRQRDIRSGFAAHHVDCLV